MIDDELIAEDRLQSCRELGRKGDLRYQVQYVLARCQLRLNEMNIDIRLPAGCHTMQQHDILSGRPESLDLIGTFCLR